MMERRFPSLEQQAEDSESMSPGYRSVTIQEIIAQRCVCVTINFYLITSSLVSLTQIPLDRNNFLNCKFLFIKLLLVKIFLRCKTNFFYLIINCDYSCSITVYCYNTYEYNSYFLSTFKPYSIKVQQIKLCPKIIYKEQPSMI